MVIAFTLEGIGIIALGYFGSNPCAFLILSAVVFLAWGEVYSLFSALAGDAFGASTSARSTACSTRRRGSARCSCRSAT